MFLKYILYQNKHMVWILKNYYSNHYIIEQKEKSKCFNDTEYSTYIALKNEDVEIKPNNSFSKRDQKNKIA